MPTPATYANALYAVWREAPASDRDHILTNCLQLLRQAGEADMLDRILAELEHREAAAQASTAVTIATAQPLRPAQVQQIVQTVTPVLPTAPQTTQTEVDPALVGGIVVRTPEVEIDASVRRVLSQLNA